MSNTQILVIVLILVALYLVYQQNNPTNQPNLASNSQEIQDLKQQVSHYQNLYQKRVEKDLAVDQTTKIRALQTNNQQLVQQFQDYKTTVREEKTALVYKNQREREVYSQKISDLENSLLNLAKQKLKGNKEAQKLVKELEINYHNSLSEKESNWKGKEAELNNDFALVQKQHQNSLQKEQEKYSTLSGSYQALKQEQKQTLAGQEKLTEQLKTFTTQQEKDLKDIQQKERTIIGLNKGYEKLEKEFKEKQTQEQNIKTYLNQQEENINELEKVLW